MSDWPVGLPSGTSINAVTETLTAPTTYTLAPTPDRVTLSLAADGLVVVALTAAWKSSVSSVGKAALFVDSTQVQIQDSGGLVNATEAATASSGFEALTTFQTGLVSTGLSAGPAAPIAIGHLTAAKGGLFAMWVAAGTHDIQVKYKASSGNIVFTNTASRALFVAQLA